MIIKSREELIRVADECRSMVTTRAVASGTAAIIPVPGTDIAVDIGVMIELFPAINRKFGLTPEQIEMLDPASKAIISRMIIAVGNELAGKIITKELLLLFVKKVGGRMVVKQIIKYIPIFGQLCSAAIAFSAMKYMGNSHIDDCCAIVSGIIEQRMICTAFA